MIYLCQDNMIFVILHKTINKQLKNRLCYCGILRSIITVPAVLLNHSYHTRTITVEFSPFPSHSILPCRSRYGCQNSATADPIQVKLSSRDYVADITSYAIKLSWWAYWQ